MKSNKGLILMSIIFLFALCLISFASAMCPTDSTELTGSPFSQGSQIELKQICDTCSYVTLSSISYPDSSSVYVNENMTKSGTDYNYSFINTSIVGTYGYSVLGDKDGTPTTATFCFEVKSGSNDGSMPLFIFLYILFYGITIFGLIRKHEWITLGGCFGLLIIGVYTASNGFDVYKNGLTDAISYITLLIGLGLGFETVYEITNY
jgi:hypothetical protein